MVVSELGSNGSGALAIAGTTQEIASATNSLAGGSSGALSFRGHRYQLSSDAFTWKDAQAEAISLGGNLVTINDAAEQAWIESSFGTTETLWTGLTDQDQEGEFAWVSGEAVTFTNWAAGQANTDPFAREYAEKEDYATLNYERTPLWADSEGTARYRGIIEIGALAETPPAPLSEVVYRGDRTQPQLFLTFDDGPVGEQTLEILDVLDQFKVKASFFLLGQQVEAFPEEARQIAAAGHVLANHSFTHDENKNPATGEVEGLTGLTKAEVRDELVRTNQVIKSVTGQDAKYFRPPFGYFDDQTHRVSDELGLTFVEVSENGGTNDWKQGVGVTNIVNTLLDNAENGYIFVLHDHGEASADALRIAIPQLQTQGFEFATLDELPPESFINAGAR